MAYDSLKSLIRQYIKTNGEQEITGQILQNVLIEMVNQYPSTDGFATQSWVTSQGYATTSQLAGYLPLTGGTITGNLQVNGETALAGGTLTINYVDSDVFLVHGNSGGVDYGVMHFERFETYQFEGEVFVDAPTYATSFIKVGGTSAQFLKADGSVDSNAYITASALNGYATQSWVTTQLGSYLPLTGGTLTGALMTSGTTQGIQLRAYFDNDTIAIQKYENNDWVSVCSLSGPGYITGSTYHGNQYIVNNGTSSQFLKADGSVDSNTYLTSASLAGYLPLTGGTITGNLQVNGETALAGGTLTINYVDSDVFLVHGNSGGVDYGVMHFERFETYQFEGEVFVDAPTYATSFIKVGGTSAQFLKADGSVDSTAYLPKQGSSFYFITDADMPETAANISTLNAAHRMTLYRNAILMPYQMDNANDGGFIRSRGTSESSSIFEIGMWDDAGAGETIQFNYYPTTSTINPTYSVTVPKKSGTIALTSDLASYNPTTNFKTINNQSIIGTGNINIEGGGGGAYYDAEIEYLQSSGTQWIDTGYIPEGVITVKISYMATSLSSPSSSGPWNIIYASNFWATPRFGLSTSVSTGWRQYNSSENQVGGDTVNVKRERTIEYPSITKDSNSSSVYIFNAHYSLYPESSVPFIGRVYSFKIEDSSGNAILDMIPVRVGNVGYLYDKVSGELFGNSGTGSFVLGQDTGPGGGLPYLPLTGGTITGNLTINSGSDNTYLKIYGSSANGYGQIYVDGDGLNISGYYAGGNLYLSGNVTVTDDLDVFSYLRVSSDAYARSFIQTSDLRKKTIMGDVPMNIYNVANAPLFKFTWKDEKKYSGQHIGSAAQYWQTVLPELVSIGRDADMTLAMQYDVIALASAITVAKTVVNHEERIILLERENDALKKEIADLKSA